MLYSIRYINIASDIIMQTKPSMGQLTNRAARLFRRLADRRLEPLGLSAGHLPVLTALMASDALSQKALTEQAGIEQPSMAAMHTNTATAPRIWR